MWQRFKRMIRSLFGSLIGVGEDPERILEQNIRDMNDQVPQMNAQIAMVRANLTLMEKEAARYQRELTDVTSKIKASLTKGREDLAMQFAVQLESLKGHAARTKLQAEAAKKAYDKAVEVKKAFMREKDRKTRDAMEVLRAARQSKWQREVADAMESFEPSGIDATHDEMVRKLEEQAAYDSARLDMALENMDVAGAQIEEAAEEIRAGELLEQFKLEMGLESAPAEVEKAAPAPKRKTRAKKTTSKGGTTRKKTQA
jgi:phage shock protein A